ncbi:MAG: pyridoxamine 5'-phosphate oxidase family protein [Micromonosporaceae bacterium]
MDLSAQVRRSIDANRYLTLGTTGQNGRPWVSPVYFATDDHTDFYWMSSPEVTHSRNIAGRPDVSIVIFDSQVPPYTGAASAVYLSATATELAGSELERGVEIYPGPPERGARAVTAAELRAPSEYRLYRARAYEHSVLCPRELGKPCGVHGRGYDHRTVVTL